MISQITAQLFLLVFTLASPSRAGELPIYQVEQESIELGKKIYTTGVGNGDIKIMAVISGREMPASIMACINCHGNCGKGNIQGGVIVPDISRESYIGLLVKDQSKEPIEKVIRSKLSRAITMGIKHEGDSMHNLMPRYKMSMTDMDHLLAYLAVLGNDDKCIKGKE